MSTDAVFCADCPFCTTRCQFPVVLQQPQREILTNLSLMGLAGCPSAALGLMPSLDVLQKTCTENTELTVTVGFALRPTGTVDWDVDSESFGSKTCGKKGHQGRRFYHVCLWIHIPSQETIGPDPGAYINSLQSPYLRRYDWIPRDFCRTHVHPRPGCPRPL